MIKPKQKIPNRGASVLRRIEGDVAHFQTVSFWDSLKSIKQFAGQDYEEARYYPKDKEFLLELEPVVTHYELFTARMNNGGNESIFSVGFQIKKPVS